MNVSDKVVCVDDSPSCKVGIPHDACPEIKNITKGTVYVVDQVNDRNVKLVGHPKVCPTCGIGIGWRKHRFRRLEEMKSEAANKQHDDQVA